MKIHSTNNLIIFSASLIILFCCTQRQEAENESYEAGFKVIQSIDKSRVYKPGTDTINYLHHRPLDIDIWYPAEIAHADSPLAFRDILGLLEKRANYYTASTAANGLTKQIAQSFCEGFGCSDTASLLNYKTGSYEDASPIDKKFPLVIYLASYNGMSFENFSLFEELAKDGFVVMSINSIGRYPGDMTMKNEDMMEQVYDAIASLKRLEQNPNIDFSRIGIIGYSWGGLSAALLARKIPNVSCLISLDGSEFHHYGQVKDEDIDFEGIRNTEDFQKMKLSIPYLRLESSPLTPVNKKDSVYNFLEKLSKDNLVLKIDSAEHQDFSCLPVIVRLSGNCKNNHLFNTITKLTKGFLQKHLKNSGSFPKTLAEEMNKSVRETSR